MSSKAVINNVKEDLLYDYVANNYYGMTKEELKDIILELIWTAMETVYDRERFNKVLIDNLKDRWLYREGEDDEDDENSVVEE